MADDNSSKMENHTQDTPHSTVEDPSLNPVHHHHSSFHETTLSEKHHDDNLKDVSLEKGAIADPSSLDSKTNQSDNDVEEADGNAPEQAWYKKDRYWRYLRHWKLAFFIAVWILFTG